VPQGILTMTVGNPSQRAALLALGLRASSTAGAR
jgi:hypothetical protein